MTLTRYLVSFFLVLLPLFPLGPFKLVFAFLDLFPVVIYQEEGTPAPVGDMTGPDPVWPIGRQDCMRAGQWAGCLGTQVVVQTPAPGKL